MQKMITVGCAAVSLAALAACSDTLTTGPVQRAPAARNADVAPGALSTAAVCSNASVTVQTHAGLAPAAFGPTVAAVVPGAVNGGWHTAITGSSWIIPGDGAGNGPFTEINAPDFVTSHYSVSYSVPANAVNPTIVGTSYADNQITSILIDNGGSSIGSNATLGDPANYDGASPLAWGGSTPTGTHTLDFYVANNNVTQPTNPTALDFCFHVDYTLPPPPPAAALFVISDDQPHAIDDIVNFWGAQWWKNNPTSKTSDNGWESFKGYASQSDNVCGGNWSSNTGNSDPPPASPLPSSINIIVTDKVNKSGNLLSGKIIQIITVTQDGHYDSNPGHAGNGTVTAAVCP